MATTMVEEDSSIESSKIVEKEGESTHSECSIEEKIAKKDPICVIVLGMAGSGKTTFVQVSLYSEWDHPVSVGMSEKKFPA